jgi:hypothetical protein
MQHRSCIEFAGNCAGNNPVQPARTLRSRDMKIKSNVRAGAGGASGAGGNSTTASTGGGANAGGVNSSKTSIMVTTYTYIPAISRCVGI